MNKWYRNQIKRYNAFHKIPMTRRTATELQTSVLLVLFIVCMIAVIVKEFLL